MRKNDDSRNDSPRTDRARRGRGPRNASRPTTGAERSPRARDAGAPTRPSPSRSYEPLTETASPTGPSAFTDLGLAPELLHAIETTGYSDPTPIQVQAIPPGLAGRDILGCAQTGTGKTAAFALPILQRLAATPRTQQGSAIRALILAPTRELAAQIGASFERYGRRTGLRTTVVFGGVSKGPQASTLRRGVDILVATPGRLFDLLGDRALSLAKVEVLVLDEADRMLDMGFIHDVRRVVRAIPRERQTMLYSATLPEEIRGLAEEVLKSPVRVAVTPVASTVEATEQIVYAIDKADKLGLLVTLLREPAMERVLVFTRTKHGADKVAKKLARAGIETAALHGNKSQGARERALDGFKRGRTRVIVATDIAARGLDVKGLTHVVNHDLPNEPEAYVHRIGRTGRAGAVGVALSFCAPEERGFLGAIERLTRRPLVRVATPELVDVAQLSPPVAAAEPARSNPNGRSSTERAGSPPARRRDGGTREARSEDGAERRPDGDRRRPQTSRPQTSRPQTSRPQNARPQNAGSQNARSQNARSQNATSQPTRGERGLDGGRPGRRRENAADQAAKEPRQARRASRGERSGGAPKSAESARSGGQSTAKADAQPWWQQARGAGGGGRRRRSRGAA
jgi:ATP-dependent RNA helicase RhlE